MPKRADIVIIGGGFYGCMIALFLSKFSKDIIILERENDILKRASYNNQARVHNGYHYPRSFITALRSHANFRKFSKDFKKAICSEYQLIYAIAANFSKTTSRQFLKFCQQIGSKVQPAPVSLKRYFNNNLIEDVFSVEEYVFDVGLLRKMIKALLLNSGVQIKYGCIVSKSEENNKNLIVVLENGKTITADSVFNCTYSGINNILRNSNFPLLPLKHELTEMPLIRVPEPFKNIGITIMDGPFFGVMPFPDRKLHTIHHVRYTPHISWTDSEHSNMAQEQKISKSKYLYMIKDATRYIPILKYSKYEESLYEVRTVLLQMENSDGRPILYRKDYGVKNFNVVLGGKIDNVYDIIREIKALGHGS